MKNIKYLALGCLISLGVSSCNDYLDVNTDPDSPNSSSATVANRLAWIQHFYTYSAGVTNMRAASSAGVYYSSNGNVNTASVTWAMANGLTTTPYQSWFVESAANYWDLVKKAQSEGATYYEGAADVMYVLGFMEMLDLYGEIPCSDALVNDPAPKYDDGKTLYDELMAKLDEAITLFQTPQSSSATAFSKGDMYWGGDASKWLKFCYGLKARYLLKVSKKTDLYNGDAILEALSKGPQSIDDNTVLTCYNSDSDVTDWLMGDPIQTNGNWDYVAYGDYQKYNKYYVDLLTNMRSAGVEDPRYSKIIPAVMSKIKLDASGKVASYEWMRAKGVDVYGDATRLLKGGATNIQRYTSYANKDVKLVYDLSKATDVEKAQFIRDASSIHAVSIEGDKLTVTYQKGSIYANSTNWYAAGDTAYVMTRSSSYLTRQGLDLPTTDENWYFNGSADAYAAGAVGSTGSFQIRPNSDFELFTYHEACFIKAEVYMRKGDKTNALKAYQDGIKAHMDYMQRKLQEWAGSGYANTNPDMAPMDDAAIQAYMASDAVCQNASDLTMKDIMLQKYVAMGCSLENWNDMRRFNYSAGNIGDFGVVYEGYDRSPLFAGQTQITGSSKTDPTYWQRRWRLPASLELSYNSISALACNPHCMDNNIWCMPVWWDCASDEEYYNYLAE